MTYTTPEGFDLPRPLLLPDVRDFAELFEYVREWDHQTMTSKSGVVPHPELVPSPVLVDNMAIGPFLSMRFPGGESRALAVKATPLTVSVLAEPSETFATIKHEGRLSFELIEHARTGRTLVLAKENQAIRSLYVAYIDPATIPAAPAVHADR